MRAIGPSLTLPGAMANPTVSLYGASGVLLAANDDWRSAQQSEILASGIAPTNDLEAAIVATLPASAGGTPYTAVITGADHTNGIGVVEVYDLEATADSRLANISTRGQVEAGDGVLIGGLIVVGNDPQNVVLRALGPSLGAAGVTGALSNPTLELHDGNGALLALNDDWRDSQEDAVIAAGLAPTEDAESAIVATLPGSPGGIGYTAIVRGANGSTGIALVEVYALAP